MTASGRAARLAIAACVLAIPLGASTAEPSDTSAITAPAPAPLETVPFAAHFETVIEPLGPDLQDINLAVPASAVDLDSFDAPIEQTDIVRDLGSGVASYYGRRFNGRRTANGERFDMRELTAAHKTLPFGSRVRVTNASNGRSVTVRINDRGPYVRGRHIDLSRAAAEQIGMISRGHARVEMELIAP